MFQKILIKLYSIIFCFFGGVVCYILIVKAITPIWSIDSNEQNKKTVIGMQQSVLTEFTMEGRPFWWLENSENYLWFANDSDEAIRGIIHLYVSKNPCGISQKLNLKLNGVRVNNVQLDDDLTKISIEVDRIEPFSRIEVSLIPVGFMECNLKNGDNRQLVAKLENWSFE